MIFLRMEYKDGYLVSQLVWRKAARLMVGQEK